MKKKVLAAASYEKQKYFMEPDFQALPEEVQKEIKILCVLTAQKLCCSFLMGFEEDGTVYFEIIKAEKDMDYDEIGAELEIKRIQTEKKELLKALKLWYVFFCTEEGQKMKEAFQYKNQIK